MVELKLEYFDLPRTGDKDSCYFENLKEDFEKYHIYMEGIDKIPTECKENIKENCNIILESIGMYYNSNIICAENKIEELLKKYMESSFVISTLNESYAFRGCAPEKIKSNLENSLENNKMYEEMMESEICFFRSRKEENKLKKEDMLHIPFDERGKIESQRFSISGTPCMYFSTTTLGNWLELDRPPLKNFQTSAYELPKDLKILNLCIDRTYIAGLSFLYKNCLEKKEILDLLEIYPLLIATSYNIKEKNRKFKSEYIISQLLMQAAKRMEIDGIAYMSKKVMDYCAYPYAVNLALIMTCDNDIEQKYWKRISEIKLTEPFFAFDMPSDFMTERCKTFINKFYSGPSCGKAYEEMHIPENDHFLYRKSVFCDFDEFLWEKPKESCKI